MCTEAQCLRYSDTVRGTVLLEEGAPAVGSVIAVRIQPNIAELTPEGEKSRLSGLLDATVLYMPTGSDLPASAHAQQPFELELPQNLGENASLCISVNSAEANALMSDRLEMKIGLNIEAEARIQKDFNIVTEIAEGEMIRRKPGYIICWPEAGDDGWIFGKRYGVSGVNLESKNVEAGKPLVIRI